MRELTPQEIETVRQSTDVFDEFVAPKSSIGRGMPVNARDNIVFDADNNRLLSVPQGMSADEINLFIGKDVDNKPVQVGTDIYGMEQAAPIDWAAFAKGAAKAVVSDFPSALSGVALEQVERAQASNSVLGVDMGQALSPMMVTHPIQAAAFKIAGDAFWSNPNVEKFVREFPKVAEKNAAKMGLVVDASNPANKLMADIGSGAASIGVSLGASFLSKNPLPALAIFGAMAKGSAYQEERQRGTDIERAGLVSNFAGIVEGGLEAVGNTIMIKQLSSGKWAKKLGAAITEGLTEAMQGVGEEFVTQVLGTREKSIQQTGQDIAYQSMLGFLVGGGAAVTIGGFVTETAQEQGIPENVARAMGAKADALGFDVDEMTEFLAKEVEPIVQDEASAREFYKLMQSALSGDMQFNEAQLNPDQRAIYDEWIKVFNDSTMNKTGVQEVESAFFDMLISAGRSDIEAASAAKIMGARADAASRALGVSPQEWFESQNLTVRSKDRRPDWALLKDINMLRAGKRYTDRAKKKPVLNYVKRAGGIDPTSPIAGDLRSIGVTAKTHPGLFRKGGKKSLDTFPISELRGAGIGMREEFDANGYATEQQIVNALADEVAAVSEQNQALDNLAQEIDMRGIDINQSDDEVIAALRSEYTDPMFDKNGDVRVNENGDVVDAEGNILFQSGKNSRGQIEFGERNTITLFETADISTVMHEMAHLFLRDMRNIASQTTRPRVRADYRAIERWLGVKNGQFTIAQEEKFARGFEAYLMEGKAPRPELQSVFDKFKEWLTSIYKSITGLNVKVTPEVAEVFDRMLGADFVRSQKAAKARDASSVDAEYEAVGNLNTDKTLMESLVSPVDMLGDFVDNAMSPISTRLSKMDENLRHSVKRFIFNTNIATARDRKIIEGFVEKTSKMDIAEFRRLDMALKNADTARVAELIEKHDLQEEYSKVREFLDDIYNRGLDAGVDVGYLDEYYPRMIKQGMGAEYLALLRKSEKWGDIQELLREKDPNGDMSFDEKAQLVNNYLRGIGYKTLSMKSQFAKERGVDFISADMMRFYENMNDALIHYTASMNKSIEVHKFLGKGADVQKSIGEYVLSMVDAGIISAEQQKELQEILKYVINPTRMKGFIAWSRDAGYIITMGSPISALTQIEDFGTSIAMNGLLRTVKASVQQKIKPKDLGLENILQEYQSSTGLSEAVRKTFKLVGLEGVDALGKSAFMTAAIDKMGAQARKNSKKLMQKLEVIFGENAEQVRKDLADGNITEDVKYLAFAELSGIQPISLDEMPLLYLNAGNGRIFYMLKTFTIKRLDLYRREVFMKITSGDRDEVIEGLQNFFKLIISLWVMGVATDTLKDFVMMRAFDLNETFMDNIAKLMAFTRYDIMMAKREGIWAIIWRKAISFPIAPAVVINDVLRDIAKFEKDEGLTLADSELFQRIPIGGKLYYWWFGGGRRKEEQND